MQVSNSPQTIVSARFDKARFEKILALVIERQWLQSRDKGLAALNDVCPNEACFDLLLDLLRRFHFFSMLEAKNQVTALAAKAESALTLKPDQTVFTCLSDPERANSSQVVLTWLKNSFAERGDWEKEQFFPDIGKAVHEVPSNGFLVLVDDFVGTGKTLTNKCAYARKVFQKRNLANTQLALVSLAAMEFSRPTIDAEIGHDKAFIGYFLPKGISDHFVGNDLANAISAMQECEALLSDFDGSKVLESFGYQKSESLYSIDSTSTPDNVFPIFWWRRFKDGNRRHTVLTRA